MHEPAGDAVEPGSGEASDVGSDVSAKPKPEEPDPVDVGKQIAELGAVPAWQGVVDRAQYLARRGQHGVVFGTIGPPVMMLGPLPEVPPHAGPATKRDAGLIQSSYVWLVDDTDGNGALAIRVLLGPKGASVHEGDRVAFGGGWALDSELKWFWNVDAVSPLPPAPPSVLKEPPAPPGHVIVNGGFPQGVHKISLAKDDDLVYFQLVGPPPASDGDGWPVGDELGSPVSALVNLPGERASYGGLDMRSPDERWQLQRKQIYWVRIGKVHKHGDKLIMVNARTAPVLVK
jgi:hypothetical protein